MIEVFTAAAVLLAWVVFRHDRHGKRRDAIEAAYGTLSAVHYGMVQGLTPGQAVGWGQIYFFNGYTPESAQARATQTYGRVMASDLDQIFVVPAEPLAKLATTTPHEGLIERKTVAVANFALWRVHVFNQLVGLLTDFNSAHADEILSTSTEESRREELASAAASLSKMLHQDGIGWSWAALPEGGRGWYGALVGGLGENMRKLEVEREAALWRRLIEWPYSAIDVLVVGGFVAVVAAVLW